MSPPPGNGPLHLAAGVVERARWLFLPLAMAALLAVGVHAAADVLSDQLLGVIDRADAAFDALVSRWSATAGLVDLVGLSERTLLARALALAIELWADAVVALPALAFEEPKAAWARVRELGLRALQRPTTLRLSRAPFAAAFALAGAVAVARRFQGTLYAALRPLLGSGASLSLARPLALGALALVLVTLGWRAALRALEHADQRSERARSPRQRLTRGLVSAALLSPLALAALLRASPLATLLR